MNGVLSQNHVLTVTGNCYSELGVVPLLGRLLTAEDSNPSRSTPSQVAVIGYEFWQSRFGGALDVVSKRIFVEGHPFTIIGVTRKWFTALSMGEPPEVTIPITAMQLLQDGPFSLTFAGLVAWSWPFRTQLRAIAHPRPGGYKNLDLNSYHKQLIEHISSLPGVGSVSFSTRSIPRPQDWHDIVSATTADSTSETSLMTNGATVSPGFFRTLGIPLLRGRDFEETDDEQHPRLAIVNSSLAERLFPDGDAIGKTIRDGFMPDFQNIEIVGIVGNARIFDFRDADAPAIFISYLQYPTQWGYLIVRTRETPNALAKTVDGEIASLGHEYPLGTQTVAQVISGELVGAARYRHALRFFCGSCAAARFYRPVWSDVLCCHAPHPRNWCSYGTGSTAGEYSLDRVARNARSGAVGDSHRHSLRPSSNPPHRQHAIRSVPERSPNDHWRLNTASPCGIVCGLSASATSFRHRSNCSSALGMRGG